VLCAEIFFLFFAQNPKCHRTPHIHFIVTCIYLIGELLLATN